MNFLIFKSVAALIWQEKKGRKKIAINSFQKKSIISIMKKKKQNYCSRQRRKGKMKKRYHKKTQAYYQTKRKCDQV